MCGDGAETACQSEAVDTLQLRPPRHQVSRRAITWWSLLTGLGWFVLLAVATLGWVLWSQRPGAITVGLVVLFVLAVGSTVVVPRWRFRIHRWETTADAVYTASGWLTQEWRVAPMSRIQTVDTQRGPLQRALGISSVTITTASGDGVGTVARAVSGTDPAVLAVATALTLLVLSVVAAVAVHVEGWWGMRLTRSDDASLHVRRGLLTTRSVTVEQARLRGVTVREPLLVRAAGGGRVDAVVSGLAHDEGSVDNAALTPAAPLRTVARVTAAALGVPVTGELTPHPLAARRRRVVRTLVPAVALLAVGVGAAARGALGWWVVPVATVVVPALALALALDRYRSLGHTVTDELLVVRQGSLVRRTTALQRPGIIGITVRRGLFQRRAGLSTVQFTTAAGSGAYELLDVGAVQGLRAAQAAVPGLLRPFLVGGARPGE